jgi:hypothetical protein
MCTPIKTLLLVLVLLVGSTSYADAGPRHGGYRGGGHGHRHYGHHHHRHYSPHYGYGHVHRFYPRFYGGIFYDVPPVWVAPAPYIGVVPAPPAAPMWYYCTDPAGYYPTVSACTVPWTPVAPSG